MSWTDSWSALTMVTQFTSCLQTQWSAMGHAIWKSYSSGYEIPAEGHRKTQVLCSLWFGSTHILVIICVRYFSNCVFLSELYRLINIHTFWFEVLFVYITTHFNIKTTLCFSRQASFHLLSCCCHASLWLAQLCQISETNDVTECIFIILHPPLCSTSPSPCARCVLQMLYIEPHTRGTRWRVHSLYTQGLALYISSVCTVKKRACWFCVKCFSIFVGAAHAPMQH